MDKKPLMSKAEFLEWQQNFVECMAKLWELPKEQAEDKAWEVTKKHFSKDNWKNCKYILVD